MKYAPQFVCKALATLAVAASLCATSQAQRLYSLEMKVGGKPSQNQPEILKNIGIDQRLNEQLPMDAVFNDDNGKQVKLGQLFRGKPVVLAMVYYDCPMLCTQVLNGLTSALTVLKFDVGDEFDVIAVSIDPRETPQIAANKKKTYLHRYGRPGAEKGWHFLTGPQESIDQVAKAVGFRYAWDESTKQFAHASGIQVITPQGHIAQYYYGIEYAPRDLRLGLVEASQNKIGNVVDQLLLYCFHYDPMQGKYGAMAMRVMRIAGATTVFLLAGFVFVMIRRERNKGLPQTGRAD